MTFLTLTIRQSIIDKTKLLFGRGNKINGNEQPVLSVDD